MMTPKTWNELSDKLTKETNILKKECVILDAFMDGLLSINEYKILIQTINAPIKSVVVDVNDFRGFPTLKCDCGAKHTSFPQHHLHWCSAK